MKSVVALQTIFAIGTLSLHNVRTVCCLVSVCHMVAKRT